MAPFSRQFSSGGERIVYVEQAHVISFLHPELAPFVRQDVFWYPIRLHIDILE